MQVRDGFVGEIKMIESGHVLKLDQEHLETVIPAAGAQVPCVSILKHTEAYRSIPKHTEAYRSIRQHTSAYVS
jgi:hypothetical protein